MRGYTVQIFVLPALSGTGTFFLTPSNDLTLVSLASLKILFLQIEPTPATMPGPAPLLPAPVDEKQSTVAAAAED